MNRNLTGISPKNTKNPPLKTKNGSSSTQTSTSSYTSPYKTAPTPKSTKTVIVQGTDRNTGGSSTPTNNLISRIAIKTPLPPHTQTALSSDNTHTLDTIALHTNINTSTNDQSIISSSNITNNNNINYSSAVAMEKTPSREQALVFNSIDGIPQKEYILAVGKIVSPKNITFISRISNNRFCIFLFSKQILDNLMQTTQAININEQTIPIRRLLNPAKRYIISNVCPSIPNHVILEALKNIDIVPISQINHLKAGINIEGYEHIMSFRRQMFIKHDDIPKLPNSLLITLNESQFRIFFSDDKITCFLCKTTGHTTNNCKNNIEYKPLPSTDKLIIPDDNTVDPNNLIENILPITSSLSDPPFDQTKTNLTDTTDESKFFSSTQNHFDDIQPHTPNETHKRLLSDTSSPKPPDSPNIVLSSTTTTKNEKTTKKPKIQSRSNSSINLDTNSDEKLKPIIEYFTTNDPSPITYIQFKYIFDNFNNKAMNIHTLLENVNTNIPTLMEIIDQIRPNISDKSLKSRLTKLSNLLFQSQPLQRVLP